MKEGSDAGLGNVIPEGGPALAFPPGEWEAFAAGVKAGEFDPD